MRSHPIITTERLELRAFTEDDLEALVAIAGDAETMRYIAGVPATREQWRVRLAEMIARFDEHSLGLMAVVVRDTGELIGRCGFQIRIVDAQEELEISCFLRRDMWGRGFAQEIGRALVDHGFRVLGRSRLISMIDPANAASIRAVEKAGGVFWKETDYQDKRALVYARER